MRVLFDHGTPAPLARVLDGHEVRFARAEGWDTFTNGALLAAADAAGFHVLVTTDKNIRYQQNLDGRRIALVVLMNAQWPVLRQHVHRVRDAVDRRLRRSRDRVDCALPCLARLGAGRSPDDMPDVA